MRFLRNQINFAKLTTIVGSQDLIALPFQIDLGVCFPCTAKQYILIFATYALIAVESKLLPLPFSYPKNLLPIIKNRTRFRRARLESMGYVIIWQLCNDTRLYGQANHATRVVTAIFPQQSQTRSHPLHWDPWRASGGDFPDWPSYLRFAKRGPPSEQLIHQQSQSMD
mgnify:CR=1 FL=1